jgi:hypothetical protein
MRLYKIESFQRVEIHAVVFSVITTFNAAVAEENVEGTCDLVHKTVLQLGNAIFHFLHQFFRRKSALISSMLLIQVRSRILPSPHLSDRLWDSLGLLHNGYRGRALSLGVNWPGRKAEHLSPTNYCRGKENAWIYLSIPPTGLHGVVLS